MKIKFKLFLAAVIAVITFAGVVLNAEAYIGSEQDLSITIQKLQKLRSSDISSFMNKGELIGYRLEDFNMVYNAYISSVSHSIEQLVELQGEIEKFKNMAGIEEKERYAQIEKLYQSANTIVSGINTETSNFVYNSSRPMPTMTYDKFKKKFWAYYYSLGI